MGVVAVVSSVLVLALPTDGSGAAQSRTGPRSLGDLFLPRGGKLIQYSSHAPKPGAADSWEVPPGSTVTLVDHRGPGVVRRWWMTFLQHVESPLIFRYAIIRCYWAMPFRSSARITIENRASVPITGLYFNIEVESVSSIAKEALYFHAQFRRAGPTVRDRPVTVLETTGNGQFVGTVLSAQTLRGIGLRFLEGDES